MEFGNNYVGGDLNKDYSSLFIFPLGLEIFHLDKDIEIRIIIWPIQLSFNLSINRTLFNN